MCMLEYYGMDWIYSYIYIYVYNCIYILICIYIVIQLLYCIVCICIHIIDCYRSNRLRGLLLHLLGLRHSTLCPSSRGSSLPAWRGSPRSRGGSRASEGLGSARWAAERRPGAQRRPHLRPIPWLPDTLGAGPVVPERSKLDGPEKAFPKEDWSYQRQRSWHWKEVLRCATTCATTAAQVMWPAANSPTVEPNCY